MARRSRAWTLFRYAVLISIAALLAFTLYLDLRVTGEFEGRRFALPARIYARPIELHVGVRIPKAEVEEELRSLGYQLGQHDEPGWYVSSGNELEVAVRPFVFWDGAQPARRVKAVFESNAVSRLTDADNR